VTLSCTLQGTATDLVVQVVLIAESMRLQAMMATYGIQTQTPHEVEPVQIWSSTELMKVRIVLVLFFFLPMIKI